MQHQNGKQRKGQVQPVEKPEQQPQINKIKPQEGRVAAVGIDPARDQRRIFFCGDTGPPAASQAPHRGQKNGAAQKAQGQPRRKARRAGGPAQQDAGRLRRHDGQGGRAQQPFHQQGPRGFIAPADLVGAHALPALGELL